MLWVISMSSLTDSISGITWCYPAQTDNFQKKSLSPLRWFLRIHPPPKKQNKTNPFVSSQNSNRAQICRSSRDGLPCCRNTVAYTGKENSGGEDKVSSIQYVTHCYSFKPRSYEYVRETMKLFWWLWFLVLATRSQSGKVLLITVHALLKKLVHPVVFLPNLSTDALCRLSYLFRWWGNEFHEHWNLMQKMFWDLNLW